MSVTIEAVEHKLQLGGIACERNTELGLSAYTKEDESITIYVSDELKHLGLRFRMLRELGIAEIQRVNNDPFGETSIDPHVSEPFARAQRSVNRLRDDIQNLVTLPIALKSSYQTANTVQHREDLLDQYLFMRRLQVQSQARLSPEQREVIEFLPVYGAVRIGDQDLLVMKRVKDAKEIEDRRVPFRSYGWPGSGDPDSELAFSSLQHVEFLEALGHDTSNMIGPVRWRTVTMRLSEMMGIPLHDLAGRNVLYTEAEEHRKYFIIDQVRS
jgi:hypothetical protein